MCSGSEQQVEDILNGDENASQGCRVDMFYWRQQHILRDVFATVVLYRWARLQTPSLLLRPPGVRTQEARGRLCSARGTAAGRGNCQCVPCLLPAMVACQDMYRRDLLADASSAAESSNLKVRLERGMIRTCAVQAQILTSRFLLKQRLRQERSLLGRRVPHSSISQ